ncbi:hypothetical protein [Paenibacillus amylolyticus]|uniref:hypothetical protein n=1 Tax=Paenibacillus amylolyticus TaxID=1451 RepID=UPI003EBB425F
MLKKTSIKSLFRITALTMAFLIFAVTGAQSYSLAAGAETLQRDQEAVNSTVESNSPEPTNNETPNIIEEAPNDETLNNDEETSLDDNFQNVNVGDLEIVADDNPTVSPMALPLVVWAGMGIGQLLGWLAGGTAAVVTIVKFGENVVRVADFAAELRKSKEKEKPKYFTIFKDKQQIYIRKPLTEREAISFLKKSPNNEIWAPEHNDARGIALKIAIEWVGGEVIGPENHFKKGTNDEKYYWHFHAKKGNTLRTGHIFYGVATQTGANPAR